MIPHPNGRVVAPHLRDDPFIRDCLPGFWEGYQAPPP